MRSDDGLQDWGEKGRSDVRCKKFKAGARALAFFVSHRTDAGASGETELILAIPSDKEEGEAKVKSRKTQEWRPSALGCFAALGHTDGTDYTDYACLAARDACGLSW